LAATSNRSPMRRGLKFRSPENVAARLGDFKPIPDEEGTEICLPGPYPQLERYFKPIPDEEGTEMHYRI